MILLFPRQQTLTFTCVFLSLAVTFLSTPRHSLSLLPAHNTLNPRKASIFKLYKPSMSTGSTSRFRSNQNAAVSAFSPDYGEVFGRLNGGGVPVLKLPVLDQDGEKELSFDLGLVDYDEVFGGYDDWSFAASYEEVFGKSGGGGEMLEEEACWTQLGDASLLKKPCHSIQSGQSSILSSDNGEQDLNRQPSKSRHRIPFEHKEAIHTSTKSGPSQETGLKNPSSERSDTKSIRCGPKSSNEVILEMEERGVKHKDILSQNGSQSNGAFMTVSGINLRTHPSKCPPPSRNPPLLYVQNEDLEYLRKQSRGERSRSYSFQGTGSSPAFHDIEVDASSSAAASAAAMLDAMEKAQAKLNVAKEMMERKKEGLTRHLKPSKKNSAIQNGSSKSKESLDQKVPVPTEGSKLLANGHQNLTNTAEMVSQYREEPNQNNVVRKFVVKRQRQGSWSCGDSKKFDSIDVPADSTDFFNMELDNKQLLEVEKKKEITVERAGTEKEHIKYDKKLSSAYDQKSSTVMQPDGATSLNESDISMEVLQESNIVNIAVGIEQESQSKESIVSRRISTDGKIRDNSMPHSEKYEDENEREIGVVHGQAEHCQMNIEADITEQCDHQGLKRKIPKLAEFESELKEGCDSEENEENLKKSYEVNLDIGSSETFPEQWISKQCAVAQKGRESQKLQSPNDNTTMSVSHSKTYPIKEHFLDLTDEFVKPLDSLCELFENQSFENRRISPGCVKLDLNDAVVRHKEEIKVKPGFNDDKLEEDDVAQDESLLEKMMAVVKNDIKTLHLDENDRNSDAGQYVAQKILFQLHMVSESNYPEEIVVTKIRDEAVSGNKVQVPVTGAMTNDQEKLPKMVNLEVRHSRKSKAASQSSFHKHHSSNEAVVTELVEEALLCNKAQMNNDRQKLPKTVDLEVKHVIKSRPASENSFHKHHSSVEAVNDLKPGKNEKIWQEQLKKLEKEREREREREKDNLVLHRALHEVHEKSHNDVERAAVETGPTEHQQKAVGDTLKPKELQTDSPQRCKARLERERRTAERAARALAEKNISDLVAQKEQTERNRLADSLGAEVKRWATGKEGNLRALLSTLQYILGPDSGWKPIPLTEVITPIAVKKAYRKATLYVHPDKVQQRGANIHQKFICEKVFDLLKDAWNRFNSDGW